MRLIPGQTQTRLGLFTASLIGATLAPQLFAVTPILTALLNSLVGVLGSLVASDIGESAKRLEAKDRTNHDLAKATGEAISLVIHNLAQVEGINKEIAHNLSRLAHHTQHDWLEFTLQPQLKGVDFSISDVELVRLMAQKAEDFAKATALTKDIWKEIITAFDVNFDTNLPDFWLFAIADKLHTTFPQALREVLKADANSGGKAYAAMSLSLMGETAALAAARGNFSDRDLGEIKAYFEQLINSSQAEQSQKFCQLMTQVESGFKEVITAAKQEIIAEVRTGFAGVNERLEKGFTGVEEQLTGINKTIEILNENLDKQKSKPGVFGGSFSGVCSNWQGREQEIKLLIGWIRDPEITLMGIEGTGGLGKTSLAAKVFKQLETEYHGYWADVTTGGVFTEVARQVLAHFQCGIPEQETQFVNALIACLQQNKCLLVFDNLETLLQNGDFAPGSFYDEFFRAWTNKRSESAIVVTTRERPNIKGFRHWILLTGWSETEGAAFLKASGITSPEAELSKFSRLVDGYPLLLQFVADLLVDDSPQNPRLEKLSDLGLGNLPQLLTHPNVKGNHRQAEVGIVAVLDASYQRLSGELQRLLGAVSVLRGEFDGELALAVSGLQKTAGEIEADLRQLTRGSWLQEGEKENRRWYSFQQVVLAYVQIKAGERTEEYLQVIEYYRSRVKPRQEWHTLADVNEYLEIFYYYCELGAYSLAFDTIYDRSGNENVDSFLDRRGYNATRVDLYRQLIANWQHEDKDEKWQFREALTLLGNAYYSLGQYQQAIACHQQHLEIAREIGDSAGAHAELRGGEAASLIGLGNAYQLLGQYQQAIAFHEQSLEITREIGDSAGAHAELRGREANSLNGLGNAYYSLGQYQQAIAFHQQSLEMAQEIGNRTGESNSLGNLGNAYYSLGQYQQAIAFLQQQLEIAREIGDRRSESNSLGNLGNAYYSLGQYQQAIAFLQQSLEMAREIGDRAGEAYSLGNLGVAYQLLGQYQQAIAFLQQSLEITREIGDLRLQAISLQNLASSYQLTGKIQECFRASSEAQQILQQLDLPFEAYPVPNWMKSVGRFAQKGNVQLAICFLVGLVAFPFALVWFVAVITWRWLRHFWQR